MRLLLLMMILMAGIATPGCAQDGFVQQNGASLSYNVFDKDGKTFVNPAPDVAGSPFYKDDWRLGQLILNDNRRYDSVRVRLNLSSQIFNERAISTKIHPHPSLCPWPPYRMMMCGCLPA